MPPSLISFIRGICPRARQTFGKQNVKRGTEMFRNLNICIFMKVTLIVICLRSSELFHRFYKCFLPAPYKFSYRIRLPLNFLTGSGSLQIFFPDPAPFKFSYWIRLPLKRPSSGSLTLVLILYFFRELGTTVVNVISKLLKSLL